MKAVKCPICYGTGSVEAGFYEPYLYQTTSGGSWDETCKSCGGVGYLVVPEG